MTTTLSTDQQNAIKALNKAVETKGADHVYPGWDTGTCNYLDYDFLGRPTGPGCIVGFVILETEMMDFDHLEGYEGTGASTLLPWGEADPATQALANAQNAQDSGETWGAARDQALEYLRESDVDLSFLD